MTEPKKLTPERLANIDIRISNSRDDPNSWDEEVILLLAHIAALEQMATVKGALNYCVLANAERDAAIARAEAAEAKWDAAKETWDAIDRVMFFTVKKRAEAAEARVKVLEAERDEWRKRCVDAEVHRARAALSTAKEGAHE